MAFEGIRSWAQATITQVERIEAARREAFSADEQKFKGMRKFQTERHLFLVAANKLTENIAWAKKLDFLEPSLFLEFEELKKDIKDMRDLNEHAIEYFLGQGRCKEKWIKEDETAIADASSTIDDRIGNRLSWNAVSTAAIKLLDRLPIHY